ALAQHEAVELAHCRAAAGGGGGRQAPLSQRAEISFHVLRGGGGEVATPPPQEGGGVGQVLAVGGQGVAGGGAFHRHHLKEGFGPGRAHGSCSAVRPSCANRVASSRRPTLESARTMRAVSAGC